MLRPTAGVDPYIQHVEERIVDGLLDLEDNIGTEFHIC